MLPTQWREEHIRAPPGPKALDVLYFRPRERRDTRAETLVDTHPTDDYDV